MGFKRPSPDLMNLVKELKYARTGEDKIMAMMFAHWKAKKEYMKLTYKEIEELEKRV